MVKNFTECNVQTKYYTVNKLDLNPNSINEQIKNYSPDVVMLMDRTGEVVNKNGTILNSTYDVRLLDTNTNKYVWRASVDFNSDRWIDDGSKELATEIIAKLKQDRIIN
jgi:ABC-type enterochelin transport system substrate-binding protein